VREADLLLIMVDAYWCSHLHDHMLLCLLQGTNHSGYEIKLATPLLLVSKVCLFNWPGAPNKDTMLDHFDVLQNAATQIQKK
jgi:hypothetical protein